MRVLSSFFLAAFICATTNAKVCKLKASGTATIGSFTGTKCDTMFGEGVEKEGNDDYGILRWNVEVPSLKVDYLDLTNST